MMEATATFEGWALIELFGHQREAGYVTTQYFGDKAMFQVDVPEFPECQETLQAPKWKDGNFVPVGSVVAREAVPGRTRLINPGAVYAMNPATETAVRAAIAQSGRRAIKVISMPASAQLESSTDEDESEVEYGQF
jgi:hypothetical protein